MGVIDFNLGDYLEKVLMDYPNLNFRDREPDVFHPSDAGKCSREVTYKHLAIPESNGTDLRAKIRMAFGNMVEGWLKHQVFSKTGVFGLNLISTQGSTGNNGSTFDGLRWHGYRDFDIAVMGADGAVKQYCIVELKAKVGYGARAMIHASPYGTKKITPPLDFTWGYPQQLALYLHDAYEKTKDRRLPIVDGKLVFFLYGDGDIAGLVEYNAEYIPRERAAHFYSVTSSQFAGPPPLGVEGKINEKVKIDDISAKWQRIFEHIKKGEFAPPDFQRRYALDDPRVAAATKTDLTAAAAGKLLIGDVKCKYCAYKDRCAGDLGIDLNYTKDELTILKNKVKNL